VTAPEQAQATGRAWWRCRPLKMQLGLPVGGGGGLDTFHSLAWLKQGGGDSLLYNGIRRESGCCNVNCYVLEIVQSGFMTNNRLGVPRVPWR
jgi:hypothetical protein